jgi:hypothetical protein
MNEPSESDRKLEQLVDRALRGMPLRPAPATLVPRVLRELERRVALPWWRHSFSRWPTPARVAFVLTCVALVGVAFVGGAWALADLGSAHAFSAALSRPWMQQAVALVGVAGELSSSLTRIVPPVWMYEGLAVSAVLYAALFGLGVAAYRMLYVDSNWQVT